MAGKTALAAIVAVLSAFLGLPGQGRVHPGTGDDAAHDQRRADAACHDHLQTGRDRPVSRPDLLLRFYRRGRDPSTFSLAYDPQPFAHWFVARGNIVALRHDADVGDQRGVRRGFRGRPIKGYSCEQKRSLAGAEHALRDIGAVTSAVLDQPFGRPATLVVGSLPSLGRVGIPTCHEGSELRSGWLGTFCATASTVNQRLFAMGEAFPRPMLWLYGNHDPLYSIDHSRLKFERFRAAGRERVVPDHRRASCRERTSDRSPRYAMVWARRCLSCGT